MPEITLFSIFIAIGAATFLYLTIHDLIQLYKEIFKDDSKNKEKEQYHE